MEFEKRGPGRPPKVAVAEESEADTMHPEMHADLRESDPHTAAEERTKQILAQGADNFGDDWRDEFAIPPHLRHPDWDMEWKAYKVNEKENHSYINSLKETGWDFVPAKRPGFDRFLPPDWKGPIIEKKGLVLMERPMAISELIRKRQLSAAREQVKLKIDQISNAPSGDKLGSHYAPDNKGASLARVKRSFESPIPN